MSMYFINCLSLDTKSKAALAIWLIVNRDLLYFIDLQIRYTCIILIGFYSQW
jgi:hypothetical protein